MSRDTTRSAHSPYFTAGSLEQLTIARVCKGRTGADDVGIRRLWVPDDLGGGYSSSAFPAAMTRGSGLQDVTRSARCGSFQPGRT
jgi:hypothetical protein